MAKKTKIQDRAAPLDSSWIAASSPWLGGLQQIMILMAAYVAGGLLLYGRAIGFPFSPLDDLVYITDNPMIRSLRPENLSAMFSLKFAGNYAPLHILAYALQYQGWGLLPAGYHAVNILLHGVISALVAMLCLRLGISRAGSLLAGILFLAHPVQAETVVWVSELKSLLAAVFFLGSFIQYTRDHETGGFRAYTLSVLLFLTSVLSKPSAVAFPVLLLAYQFVFRTDRAWISLRKVTPFALISLFTARMAMSTQAGGALQWQGRLGAVWSMTGSVAVEYVRHLLLPFNLSPYYYIVPEEVPVYIKIGTLLLLLEALAATLQGLLRRRKEAFWAAWFFIMFLPNANIVPLDVLMADRYLYLPCIGLIVLFSSAMVRLWNRQPDIFHRRLVAGGVAASVLAMSATTNAQTSIWKDAITFYAAIVRQNPSPRFLTPLAASYRNLGDDVMARQTMQKAIVAIRKELLRQPDNWELYQQLGIVYDTSGEQEKAKEALLKAVELFPGAPDAVTQLGLIYMREKNFGKAVEVMEPSVNRFPYLLKPRLTLIQAITILGDLEKAKRMAEGSVDLWPDDKIAVAQLADLCMMTGDNARAVSLYNRVIQLDPGSSLARSAEEMIRKLSNPR